MDWLRIQYNVYQCLLLAAVPVVRWAGILPYYDINTMLILGINYLVILLVLLMCPAITDEQQGLDSVARDLLGVKKLYIVYRWI